MPGAELRQRPKHGREVHQQYPGGAVQGLRYAADCEIIAKAPKVGLFKVEWPEIVAWDFAQYARFLAAAKAESPEWYAAVCLAGEAGLRVGEVEKPTYLLPVR